jgi:hypothetical protein
MVFDVSEKVGSIQVMISNLRNIRCLDPTKNLLITVEDAMGAIFQISDNFFEDWEVGTPMQPVAGDSYANTGSRT